METKDANAGNLKKKCLTKFFMVAKNKGKLRKKNKKKNKSIDEDKSQHKSKGEEPSFTLHVPSWEQV